MKYGIGIDTGGTYTDAVIYDLENRAVVACGKSPTTRHDLAEGIGKALDMLPADLLHQAEMAALSTTLATNACVENRGGRARLLMLDITEKTLHMVGADKKYGFEYEDVLCLDGKLLYGEEGKGVPDWAQLIEQHDSFFSSAAALSVVESNAKLRGAAGEQAAHAALTERYNVPMIMASELSNQLNMIERGATALLNARLLPVIHEFMESVGRALTARGMNVLKMIVRSDGSLMSDGLTRQRPVETILSGPAASVLGSRAMADASNCLVVDMGGTTTDISIVRDDKPLMTGGIRIGGWRTQVRGVSIDTFGLGGDTRLYAKNGMLMLDTCRVEPLCVAASKWPRVKEQLMSLLEEVRAHTLPIHEFLYLVRRPDSLERYNAAEIRLIDQLANGPRMIGENVSDMYALDSARLEREGVVMRCGLTPTDIMHIRGDYSIFDGEASRIAARHFLRTLQDYQDTEESLERFCEDAYDLVKRRLYENIARVFIESAYPNLCKDGLDEQLKALISLKWEKRNNPEQAGFFRLTLDADAALVGIGAPTHIFLPDVAKVLGVECIIPEQSAVANAVGAIVADISAQGAVEIRANYTTSGFDCYSIHGTGVSGRFETQEEALEAAQQAAVRLAETEARKRGAMGELDIRVDVIENKTQAFRGTEIDLGTTVVAQASGRVAG